MSPKVGIIIAIVVAAIVIISLIIWIVWGNKALEQNTFALKCAGLPKSFEGYRIAHVSDLHNTEIGENNGTLLKMLRESAPDMIAITGDLIDSRNTDMEIALQFITEAVKIAPCYYVTGNHESRIAQYPQFRKAMEAAGVIVLDDMCVTISRGGETVTLIGVNDPGFFENYDANFVDQLMANKLAELCNGTEGFQILLAHRPHLLETYADANVNLVLSGHAHGGQFRLPFIGGVYVPSQGLFPEYDAGLYIEGNTQMIVSRGIGNSVFPFRLNNRPEILIIELQSC